MKEDLLRKLEVVSKSAEILLDHYETKAFKDSSMEVMLKNIIAMSQEAIAEIKEEKAPGAPQE